MWCNEREQTRLYCSAVQTRFGFDFAAVRHGSCAWNGFNTWINTWIMNKTAVWIDRKNIVLASYALFNKTSVNETLKRMVQVQTMAKIKLCITPAFTATCVCCCKSFCQGKNTPQKESPVLLPQSLCAFTQGTRESWFIFASKYLCECSNTFIHMLGDCWHVHIYSSTCCCTIIWSVTWTRE